MATDYSAIFPYRYKPLSIQDFDEIKPSTRTCLIDLQCDVDLKKFFEYAHLTEAATQPKIKRKKIKIQQLDIEAPGSIISLCYAGEYKGIQTRQDPKPFLNQLTFIMSLNETNVNFKLFNNGKIQGTGCKTKQHEYDIIQYVVAEGRRIEAEHGVAIFGGEPVLTDSATVMINVDFKLGFNIDRKALNAHISGLNGFESIFDENLTNSGVSIKMPRSDAEDAKKDTLICFHTGTVLLSGNDLEEMKKLYYKFMETIDAIKAHIVTSPKSIKLQKRRVRVMLMA